MSGFRRSRGSVAVLFVLLVLPGALRAQDSVAVLRGGLPLSLQAALGRALEASEEVRLAQARVDGAHAQVRSARAAALPQVNTQLSYTRALRSVFQDAGGGFSLPDSLRFDPDSTASLEERISYLERRVPSAAFGALGSLFSDLPFGNENTWIAGMSLSQPLFAGGRISSAIDLAQAGERAARAGLDESRGEIVTQVKQAYYDALLADRSAAIVETSVGLAREHLAQVRLRLDAGRASELEVLRAEVEAENLGPQLVQVRNARELALMNLKRLINLPADAAVELTTELDATTSSGALLVDLRLPNLAAAEAQLRQRGAIRQAEQAVAMRDEQVDIARAAYLPSVALTGNLTRQAFPSGTFGIPSAGDWRDDWNVGFAVQWPLFQGFRRGAEVDAARAERRTAELQLDQLREGVRLEYEQALGELRRAQAQVAAVGRTVEQAQRVYELTELRYDEGLATQLDVSNARLALQQARINQVRAYHDAYSALARAERALGIPAERTVLP